MRRGENVSPPLFSVFLNDLEEQFKTHSCNGICFEKWVSDIVLAVCWFVCFTLHDDVVLLADGQQHRQHLLDVVCCSTWQCLVVARRIIYIFKNIFKLGNMTVENVEIYKYLGIIFHTSNKFNTRKALFSQAQNVMHFILKHRRFYNISVQVHLKLFDCILQPFLLYGSRI